MKMPTHSGTIHRVLEITKASVRFEVMMLSYSLVASRTPIGWEQAGRFFEEINA